MGRALWLADALRAEGVTVVEEPGWRDRGKSSLTPRVIVAHHTAGPAGDAPSLGTVTRGRPDVVGPLCNVLLARSGVAHVVASGVSNNAGRGSWKGITGNSNTLGIEAENNGVGEPWPAVQLEAYVRICAAMARAAGIPVSNVIAHREWAPGRKPDPVGIDMTSFRSRVALRLAGNPEPEPQPEPEPDPLEDDVAGFYRSKQTKQVWSCSGAGTRMYVPDMASVAEMAFGGLTQMTDGKGGIKVVDESFIQLFRVV